MEKLRSELIEKNELRGKKAKEYLIKRGVFYNTFKDGNFKGLKIDLRSLEVCLCVNCLSISYQGYIIDNYRLGTLKNVGYYGITSIYSINKNRSIKKDTFKGWLKIIDYKYKTFRELLKTYRTFKKLFNFDKKEILFFNKNNYYSIEGLNINNVDIDFIMNELKERDIRNIYIFDDNKIKQLKEL